MPFLMLSKGGAVDERNHYDDGGDVDPNAGDDAMLQAILPKGAATKPAPVPAVPVDAAPVAGVVPRQAAPALAAADRGPVGDAP